MQKKIFLISGFSDIEIAGNQSMKNGIKYLSEFGYKIFVFSFFPKDYPNLQNPKSTFSSNVEFHRAPSILSSILYFGKKMKDFLGKDNKDEERIKINQIVEYYAGYNFLTRILYIIALFFFYLPIELLRVFVYCLKEKPDIFYGVNWQGAIAASLLGVICRKPVITRFHGTTLKPEGLRKLKQKILLLDEILALKSPTSAVVMLDDGTKGDQVLRLLNVPENKIYFWRNGIDVDDLMLVNNWLPDVFKQELGLAKKKIILMISRLARWKRVDRGIYCIYKLVKEYKIKNIDLLILGEGPERKFLEELVEKLGVRECIQFLGAVPHKEIAKYYSIGDIFMSLYDITNLGNPLLEALYFGLPIITVDDGSTYRLLENGYNSFLVKLNSLEKELPLIVKLLLENDGLREKVRQNSIKTFQRKVLTWKKRMLLEDELIKRLLKEKND